MLASIKMRDFGEQSPLSLPVTSLCDRGFSHMCLCEHLRGGFIVFIVTIRPKKIAGIIHYCFSFMCVYYLFRITFLKYSIDASDIFSNQALCFKLS